MSSNALFERPEIMKWTQLVLTSWIPRFPCSPVTLTIKFLKMAFSVGKTFANASKRFALRASTKSSLPRCARSLLTVCRDPPTIRPFTRSMWFMCNPGPDAKSEVKSFMKPVPVTKTCGSCLHTESKYEVKYVLRYVCNFEDIHVVCFDASTLMQCQCWQW